MQYRTYCVLFVVLAGSAIAAVADDKPKTDIKGTEVKYQRHGRPYFVRNTFEKNAAESFAVLKSLDEFNKVMGVGMVMRGPKPTVNAKTFDKQIALLVVKRGPMVHYTVDAVRKEGKTLKVYYTVKTDPPGTATFFASLILTVPKGEYSSVVFLEDGKEVKEIK
jgi:hypothetical protein